MQLLFNTLIGGAINAFIGVGLQLAYSTTRVLHLAHGVVVLGAGYIAFELQRRGVSFPIAVLGAAVVAVVVGCAMERGVYAPMRRRGATGFGLLLASFALLAVGTNVLLMRYAAGAIHPPSPFSSTPWIVGGAAITPLQMLLLALTGVVLMGLAAVFRWTRFGVALRAVADHAEVAAVVGVPVARVQLAAFALASAIGGVAGALLASELALTPEIATLYAVKGFASAVIGGAGSVIGAVIGGFLLAALQQVGSYTIGGGWQDAIVFGLVFVFLVVRPRGLFGRIF